MATYKMLSCSVIEDNEEFPYLRCEFGKAGVPKALMNEASNLTLNLLPSYNFTPEEKLGWCEEIKEDPSTYESDYEIDEFSISCEELGVEPYYRKDSDGKYVKDPATKKPLLHTLVTIFAFCNENGEFIKSTSQLTKIAKNRYNSSKRIVPKSVIEAQLEAKKKAEEAKKASSSSKSAIINADTDDPFA